MDTLSKDKLEYLHMLLLTKDSLITTDAEFDKHLPAADVASFQAHLNAERDTRSRLLQAMHGIISLIRYLAKEQRKVIPRNCTASHGFLSVSTITAYLNAETDWSNSQRDWWNSMLNIQSKGKLALHLCCCRHLTTPASPQNTTFQWTSLSQNSGTIRSSRAFSPHGLWQCSWCKSLVTSVR